MAEIGKDINKAKELLQEGKLVAIPTETVYGLAANALDADAVIRIFKAKDRPQFDPLIVHVSSIEKAGLYVSSIPDEARTLADEFWPGPLTIILPKKDIIPDLVTSGLPTVGMRCPDHGLTTSLLDRLTFPLAAPSANPFGYVSPTSPRHVDEQLGDKVSYILDGGECKVGIESTIITFAEEGLTVLRLGGLSIEAIEHITGKKPNVSLHATSNPKSPGQLESHYAPSRRLILGNLDELLQRYPAHCSGLLTFSDDYHSPHQCILSREGSLEEAARNLFSSLRKLDKMDIDVILAEPVPDTGLGRAINDRLKRAAAGSRH